MEDKLDPFWQSQRQSRRVQDHDLDMQRAGTSTLPPSQPLSSSSNSSHWSSASGISSATRHNTSRSTAPISPLDSAPHPSPIQTPTVFPQTPPAHSCPPPSSPGSPSPPPPSLPPRQSRSPSPSPRLSTSRPRRRRALRAACHRSIARRRFRDRRRPLRGADRRLWPWRRRGPGRRRGSRRWRWSRGCRLFWGWGGRRWGRIYSVLLVGLVSSGGWWSPWLRIGEWASQEWWGGSGGDR